MALYPQIQALVRRAEENFPVASFMLPKPARRAVLHFYSFARNADDIADSADIPTHEKTTTLKHLQAALHAQNAELAPDWAKAYFLDVAAKKSDKQHGIDLLHAFLQDAIKNRYANYDELLTYCRYSAAPVGRVVLECSGETTANLAAADALCAVLQLINHLQDCKKDYLDIDRVYLPQDWMLAEGADDTMLAEAFTCEPLRNVFDRYLEECRLLLATAAPLPKTVRSLRLRLELALILELAHALVEKLSRHDPLQKPIKLAHWRWPFYLLRSLRRL